MVPASFENPMSWYRRTLELSYRTNFEAMKYQRKDSTIDAVVWDGAELSENPEWLQQAMQKRPGEENAVIKITYRLHVWTATGEIIAGPGDYIVRHADSNIYPYHPEIFLNAFEPCKE